MGNELFKLVKSLNDLPTTAGVKRKSGLEVARGREDVDELINLMLDAGLFGEVYFYRIMKYFKVVFEDFPQIIDIVKAVFKDFIIL